MRERCAPKRKKGRFGGILCDAYGTETKTHFFPLLGALRKTNSLPYSNPPQRLLCSVISNVHLFVLSMKNSKNLRENCKGPFCLPPFGVGHYVTCIMWVRPSLLTPPPPM